MDVNAFMEKYSKKELNLRDVELLSKRISNNLKEFPDGFELHVNRLEAIKISSLLDDEIRKLRGMK